MQKFVEIDVVTGDVVAMTEATIDSSRIALGSDRQLLLVEAFPAEGTRWDGKTFVEMPVPAVRVVSKLAFSQLFTQAERMAIRARRGASDTVAAIIEDFYSMLAFAEDVNLDHAMTQAGINFMASQGLLTADRAAAILANQPPV